MTEHVYAQALYELCKDENKDAAVLEQLKVLKTVLSENGDYIRLLCAPNLPKEERCRILDDAFRGRVDEYVLNFFKLMTERGLAKHLAGCCESYRDLYNRDHGIVQVTAVTAVPMTEAQVLKLTGKLSELTGKTVEISNLVDAACVGGVRLDYDGKRVDDTVRNRLDAVRAMLKNTTL